MRITQFGASTYQPQKTQQPPLKFGSKDYTGANAIQRLFEGMFGEYDVPLDESLSITSPKVAYYPLRDLATNLGNTLISALNIDASKIRRGERPDREILGIPPETLSTYRKIVKAADNGDVLAYNYEMCRGDSRNDKLDEPYLVVKMWPHAPKIHGMINSHRR